MLRGSGIGGEVASDHEHVAAVADEGRLGHGVHGAGEAEEMYGLEQIALSHAVVAEQTVDARRELQPGLRDILEIQYVDTVEAHQSSFSP